MKCLWKSGNGLMKKAFNNLAGSKIGWVGSVDEILSPPGGLLKDFLTWESTAAIVGLT